MFLIEFSASLCRGSEFLTLRAIRRAKSSSDASIINIRIRNERLFLYFKCNEVRMISMTKCFSKMLKLMMNKCNSVARGKIATDACLDMFVFT